MKNQFSRIISLAYEEDPSNIFFADGDMTGIPLKQLFVDCIEEMRLQTCDLNHSDDARLADART